MINHHQKTEAIFERVLDSLDRGVPVSKIQDEFAPDEQADVSGAIAAVQALIAEREGITAPPELLSQIVENVAFTDTVPERRLPWVRFSAAFSGVNPLVKVGVPAMAFAAILLAVISSRTGTVPGKPTIVGYDTGSQQTSGVIAPAPSTFGDTEKVSTVRTPGADGMNSAPLSVVAPQAAGLSAKGAVSLVIEAALADAAADQVIATNDMANAGLIANDSAAVNDLGQFFDPNAL